MSVNEGQWAMSSQKNPPNVPDFIGAAGLPADAVSAWNRSTPKLTGSYTQDREHFSNYWLQSAGLIGLLPAANRRNEREQAAARSIVEAARRSRTQFLRDHVESLYGGLTADGSRHVRVEDLVMAAAAAIPGLVPGRQELAAEAGRLQRDRTGMEIDQGLFIAAVLAQQKAGRHLCHSMLLPRPESLDLFDRFRRDGVIELNGASVRRSGRACVINYVHPRFLNAEDEGTLDGMEICVDVALLDDASDVIVLRGAQVEHPKYRGLAVEGEAPPDEWGGPTIEKLWIAAVEGFAIGGHCQVLLACDYVVAERDAYLTLPARKEGIIPGAANLRLPRFTGDRIARQAILYGRRIDCASPEGRLICDATVDAGTMDVAVDELVSRLTSSGVVSAAGNRRAFRIAEEPLDLFRTYMAVYAREQAYCHFSPALISNLERYWNAQDRAL